MTLPIPFPRRALLAALVLGAPLAAHEPGTLSGLVRDPAGRPLAGALVEVGGAGLSAPLRALTTTTGAYRFQGLPKGTFQVQVRFPGYFTAQRTISTVHGHAVTLDLVLHVYSATVEVSGRADLVHVGDLDAPVNHLLGIADTASQGVVTPAKLEERAYLRTGEVLETVPGLLISQHSGEGKANQYYLRGFNLDHGTDVSTTVAGLPVNLPTHAHGQGYSDLNFLIPELISNIQYEKGPYFADEGDFSAAGAVHLHYLHRLDRPLVQIDLGGGGFRRGLAAGSVRVGGGDLLGAVEGFHNDGPWTRPDDYRRFNGVLRWSWAGTADAVELTAMTYSGRWNSTDQVPERAVASGLLDRFGHVDPTDGGSSHRTSFIAAWRHAGDGTLSKVEAYASRYALDLFSNFTYFLDDPVHGDQFQQADRRVVTGLRASQRWSGTLFGLPTDTEVGLQVRHDAIGTVGIFHTEARQILSTNTLDRVSETTEAIHLQNKLQWSPAVRTVLGLREDLYQFDVRSDRPENAGQAHASLMSPKASLILGPWRDTEVYLSFGQGFHSNDARGTTLTVDPVTGDPAAKVTPLVRATGWEVGLRSTPVPAWQTTLSLWRLDLGSELIFTGDSGTTEASRPTRRVGVEWNNEVRLGLGLTVNADLAWSRARYRDFDPAGDRVPAAIQGVGVVGIAWKATESLDLSALDRYFGPRDLVEDGRVRSRSSNLVQLQARWKPTPHWTFTVDLFNAFDAQVADIDYLYTSRLPGEPAGGVEDLHTHPVEPRTLRAGVRLTF